MSQVKTKQQYNIFPANVLAHTTDRSIDFTFTEDKNISRVESLLDSLQTEAKSIANISQVHGDNIIHVTEEYSSVEEADALITSCKNIAIVVRTADCLPIFLYDPISQAIGLVHAGWKSSYKKITAKTVHKMQSVFGALPDQLQVAFGPCICQESYQVGVEFWNYFPKHIKQEGGRYFLDLLGANRSQLLSCGVLEQNIEESGICTVKSHEHFSYRREKEQAGRMLSIMMLKED